MLPPWLNWLRRKNTMMGVAGVVIITLALYADFSYWADTIDVEGPFVPPPPPRPVPPNGTEELFWSATETDTLPHGHRNRDIIDPLDEEDTTYRLWSFTVPENATRIHITCDGDPGLPRLDGGDRNDMDLYLYRAGNTETADEGAADFSSLSPTIQEEIVVEEKSIKKYGEWTLRADCYTGTNVEYTLTFEVYWLNPEGNATGESL